MGDVGRQFEILFNDIKTWAIGVWNDFYGYLANALGENVAGVFLIAAGALILMVVLTKIINRD